MAKGAAGQLCFAVGTLLLTSFLAGICNAAGAAAQAEPSSTPPANPATPAVHADAQPHPRPGGRKGLFENNNNKQQVQPQAYAALIGQPLQGIAGSTVELPEVPQSSSSMAVQWEATGMH
ncbi:hypothetical protein OEZ85_005561 [Tetradesmus obliquus]|uniref:Uncharacterized protein n=1 Tax=Tetradesmus obliquus TaxID=3088 RepID=A0ABY8UEY9_TETOB|nr:hypothetical protein OEZ85_005561 [Tetradesmus obliquus]